MLLGTGLSSHVSSTYEQPRGSTLCQCLSSRHPHSVPHHTPSPLGKRILGIYQILICTETGRLTYFLSRSVCMLTESHGGDSPRH